MSLGKQVVKEIERQAAAGTSLPLTATADSGSASATVVLKDRDRLGSLASGITVAASAKAPGSTRNLAQQPDVRRKAEEFSTRTAYLPETLQYVETDAGGKAILRSSPETMRGRGSEYFEARVGEHDLSLQRFKPRPAGGGRDSVPFHATDDLISRVTDDAVAALNPVKKKP